MPELPEVETARRGLAPVMEGARFTRVEVNRPNLRFPFPQNFAARLEGRKITAVARRAKYLTVDLDSDEVLIMHLGMSGSFHIDKGEIDTSANLHLKPDRIAAHDHVKFFLSLGAQKFQVTYNDPRRFGFMDLIGARELATHKYFAALGIEPTGNSLDGPCIAKLFENRKTPLKSALLDQKLIAGLGNIYVCEALWQAALSPERKAQTLSAKSVSARQRSDLLAEAIRDVIARAIEAGGSSLSDHRQTDGTLGYFQHSFNVYGREGETCPAPDCQGHIARIVQSGRSTFYCRSCQK